MKVGGSIILPLQTGQLQEEVGCMLVQGLATNRLLGTAFSNRNIERILPKAGTSSQLNSSPTAIAKTTKKIPATYVETNEYQEPAANFNVETLCVSASAIRLLSMSKRFVQVKTAVGGTRLVEAPNSLAGRHQARVAQSIEGTAQEYLFGFIVTINQTRIYSSQNGTKAAKYSLLPLWFVPTAEEGKPGSVDAFQSYRAPKRKQGTTNQHDDTT